jgi:Protein of unknown function (DUF3551)
MTKTLRKITLAALTTAAALAAATPASAQYYPWCLVLQDKNGSWTCYFKTREQCMMSAGGNIGFCAQNPAYPGPAQAEPHRRRPNG